MPVCESLRIPLCIAARAVLEAAALRRIYSSECVEVGSLLKNRLCRESTRTASALAWPPARAGGRTRHDGHQDPQLRTLPNDLSLEDLVPEDHFYRRLEARLDLSFVRELVAPLYAKGGRPSVDPVVFFKLQLVMFFEDLRSERQLMRVAADRLSVRWYLGYDLIEPLPDHSSLPASGNASAWRSSGASSRGSLRSASRRGWCGARSCSSTPPR